MRQLGLVVVISLSLLWTQGTSSAATQADGREQVTMASSPIDFASFSRLSSPSAIMLPIRGTPVGVQLTETKVLDLSPGQADLVEGLDSIRTFEGIIGGVPTDRAYITVNPVSDRLVGTVSQGGRVTQLSLAPEGDGFALVSIWNPLSDPPVSASVVHPAGPQGYTWCADESGTCAFSGTMAVAFGANGPNGQWRFNYAVSNGIACTNAALGPDPAPGFVKACFTMSTTAGPPGFSFCANEGSSCVLVGTQDIAYGASGRFSYLFGLTGTQTCSNSRFTDPAPGIAKKCYVRTSAAGVCGQAVKTEPVLVALDAPSISHHADWVERSTNAFNYMEGMWQTQACLQPLIKYFVQTGQNWGGSSSTELSTFTSWLTNNGYSTCSTCPANPTYGHTYVLMVDNPMDYNAFTGAGTLGLANPRQTFAHSNADAVVQFTKASVQAAAGYYNPDNTPELSSVLAQELSHVNGEPNHPQDQRYEPSRGTNSYNVMGGCSTCGRSQNAMWWTSGISGQSGNTAGTINAWSWSQLP